jgi:hypothetical protein
VSSTLLTDFADLFCFGFAIFFFTGHLGCHISYLNPARMSTVRPDRASGVPALCRSI